MTRNDSKMTVSYPIASVQFLARLGLAALALLAAPVARAEITGGFSAICQLGDVGAPLQMRFTRYRDVVVWSDRHGLNSSVTDMGQWGTTFWEGAIDTQNGRYRLTGENGFVEAWPVGGVYSDMITLELTPTGENRFTLRDFFNDGPPHPCRVTRWSR